MTKGNVELKELDRLSDAWDQANLGRTALTPAENAADLATIKSLHTLADVTPQVGRQIWINATTQPRRFAPGARRNAATQGGALHLVAPAASGWGWLPAGAVAVAASLAIFAGVLLGRGDGHGVTATIPGADASSVVATLPSSAPAWATPGSKSAD